MYATDIILLALFAFWLRDCLSKKELRITNYKLQIHDYFLLGFLVVAAVSIKNSSDFFVGAFLWLKLVEFALLYFYLKTYALGKFNFFKILYALILGGIFQATIGVIQFLKQGSLGLSSFGESVLGPHVTGVASFFVASGEKVIRAYGTTPHPNVLAAYLFLSIFAFYFLSLYAAKRSIIYWAYPIMLVGLFFTFSRVVIFLWAAGFLAMTVFIFFKGRSVFRFWENKYFRAKVFKIFWLTLITCIVFSVLYWPEIQSRMTITSEEEAVRLRVFYNEESIRGKVNLFGIGLGDFTPWLMEQNPNLPRYVYQPVHNTYLLIYSEIGIIGFIMFLVFIAGLIYKFIKKTKLAEMGHYFFLLVVASVLFMGLFDHFLLTLQQGRFVFWMILTLLAISDTVVRVQSSLTSGSRPGFHRKGI